MRPVTPNPNKERNLQPHVEADQSAYDACPPCRAGTPDFVCAQRANHDFDGE
jgi:hypothetical protein